MGAISLSSLVVGNRSVGSREKITRIAMLMLLVASVLLAGQEAIPFTAASLPLIVLLLYEVNREGKLGSFLSAPLSVLVGLETLALAHWVLTPLVGGLGDLGLGPAISSVEAGLFYFLCAFGPILLLTALFVWAIALGAGVVGGIRSFSLKRKGLDIQLNRDILRLREADDFGRWRLPRILCWLLVGSAFTISVMLALYPYLPTVNPGGAPVGTDLPQYAGELTTLLAMSPAGALSRAFTLSFGGARPAFVVVLYSVGLVTGMGELEVTQCIPILLGPLLVGSTLLMMLAQNDLTVSALSAFLVAASPTALGSMYGGLLANWFALSLSYLSIGALLVAMRADAHRKEYLSLSGALLGLTALAHPWTWSWVVFCLGIDAIAMALIDAALKQWPTWKSDAKAIITVVVISLLIDFTKSVLFGSQEGLILGSEAARRWSGIVNLFMMGPNIDYVLRIFLGGVLSNWLLFVLSIVGGYRLVRSTNRFGWFLISSLVAASGWFPFSNEWAQHRIMLITPFPMLAAVGVVAVASTLQDSRHNRIRDLFITFVLLASATYALRSAVNMAPQ